MTWNGWERDEVNRLRERIDRLEMRAMGVWWLIECGSPATYFCADGDWCNSPHHAHRFATKAEAEAKAATMTTMEPVRVCEHRWDVKP